MSLSPSKSFNRLDKEKHLLQKQCFIISILSIFLLMLPYFSYSAKNAYYVSQDYCSPANFISFQRLNLQFFSTMAGLIHWLHTTIGRLAVLFLFPSQGEENLYASGDYSLFLLHLCYKSFSVAPHI